jgi:hypothetical protein
MIRRSRSRAIDSSTGGTFELSFSVRPALVAAGYCTRVAVKPRFGKVANFPFNSQTCGEGLKVRHLRLHGTLRTFASGEMFRQEG